MRMEYKGKDSEGHEGGESADDEIHERVGEHTRYGMEYR